MNATAEQLTPEIEAQAVKLDRLRQEVSKVMVGQSYMIDRLLMALIADGHILLEGIPGLAKTTAVKSVADAIHTHFSRVSFTPDLLPADLIGTEIYRPQHHDFVVKKGPLFTNLLLADEINRAPAKVQSALLEAMQERQ
ncbi:MAG: AAA family ATPase, partial [Acidobacteria bacterium]|nr:AAA family ATPase [Acidobacteriota bacterium]